MTLIFVRAVTDGEFRIKFKFINWKVNHEYMNIHLPPPPPNQHIRMAIF